MASNDTFTAEVPKRLKEAPGFGDWEDSVDGTILIRVEATKETVKSSGVITNAKALGGGLYEKKWQSGLRLYFAVVQDADGHATLLILGSGKGSGQNKAINEALGILKQFRVYLGDIRKKD